MFSANEHRRFFILFLNVTLTIQSSPIRLENIDKMCSYSFTLNGIHFGKRYMCDVVPTTATHNNDNRCIVWCVSRKWENKSYPMHSIDNAGQQKKSWNVQLMLSVCVCDEMSFDFESIECHKRNKDTINSHFIQFIRWLNFLLPISLCAGNLLWTSTIWSQFGLVWRAGEREECYKITANLSAVDNGYKVSSKRLQRDYALYCSALVCRIRSFVRLHWKLFIIRFRAEGVGVPCLL